MTLVAYSESESDPEVESDTQKRPSTNPILRLNAVNSRPPKRKASETIEQNDNITKLKPKPPPLPKTFHSLYATNVRTSTTDDPSLHGGRKRQTAHVQGSWPTHVYFEWLPTKSQLSHLDALISHIQSLFNNTSTMTSDPTTNTNTSSPPPHKHQLVSFLRSPLSAPLPLHISLSTPLVLSSTTKDSFHDTLVAAISLAGIGPIRVRITKLDLVPNFEGSRWFLVLRVEGHGLESVLGLCNRVCEEFGLGTLYKGGVLGIGVGGKGRVGIGEKVSVMIKEGEDGDGDEESNNGKGNGGEEKLQMQSAFHVSIAWMLEGVPRDLTEEVRRVKLGHLAEESIEFDRVMVKIGNVVDDVLL